MWCCDTCEEWFHPRCIGCDDKETPPRKDTAFMCIPCLNEHLKNWPVQRLKDLVQFDDEDLEDEGDMISMKAVEKHMLKVYERCWYIVRLEGKNSDVPWMKRHLMYVKEMGLPSSSGFGEALFSQQAIYMIKINLTNRFQEKKKKSGIYSIHYTMPSMANDELRTSFEKEIGESENYIQKVLLKEAMVVIVQEGTEDSYDAVNAELQKTESKKRITANYLLLNYMVKEREEYLKKLQSLKYD